MQFSLVSAYQRALRDHLHFMRMFKRNGMPNLADYNRRYAKEYISKLKGLRVFN